MKEVLKSYLIMLAFLVPVCAVIFLGSVLYTNYQKHQKPIAVQSVVPLYTFDPQQLLIRMNEERQAKGLQPLKENVRLDKVAQQHAEDMKNKRYYSHTSPDGITYAQRIATAVPEAKFGAENQDNMCPETTIDNEWDRIVASQAHYLNVVSPHLNTFGIGYIESDRGTCNGYWVTTFAQL